jgi:hypothetical protein
MLVSARRELAMLEALRTGVQFGPAMRIGCMASVPRQTAQFRHLFEEAPVPYLLLHPGPGLHILDINDPYATASMTSRNRVAGDLMFNVFPDNPTDDLADGVNNLFASLVTAAKTGRPHRMATQRYDIRDHRGQFVERHWEPLNTPLFDDEGRLLALLHQVEDVTARQLQRRPAPQPDPSPDRAM